MLDRKCEDPILSNVERYKEWVETMVKQILEEEKGFFHRVIKDYRSGERDAHLMICTVRKAKLGLLRQEMKHVKHNLLIVVSLFPMSSNNEKFLSSKQHPDKRIQLFYCNQLQTNITHHTLVPKHRLMDDSEKAELFKKLKLDESQIGEFPLLTRKDPIVLYYDFPVGSLIEIERHTPFIGNTKFYRWIR